MSHTLYYFQYTVSYINTVIWLLQCVNVEHATTQISTDRKKHLTRSTQDCPDLQKCHAGIPRFWVWGQEEGEQKCWQTPWNDEQLRQPKCQQSSSCRQTITSRHCFSHTLVSLDLTGDWDIWIYLTWCWHVTKGSGLEMMAVKREKAVNELLPIHRISQRNPLRNHGKNH